MLGEDAEARRLAEEEVALAEAFGAPHPHGAALRVAALVGESGAREARLREAIERLEAADAPLELGRAQADLGAELRRRNDRAAARELHTRALERAVACGAGRLSGFVREELAALGVRPPRVVAAGRALTPAERRVAELAAEGYINREIAQRLFVTEKTVETHLSASYRKLGVRTRRDLPDALAVT